MDLYYAPFILLLLYFLYKLYFQNSYKKLPPGPWGLPLFGCLPFFKNFLYIELRDLGRKYGTSLLYIQLGMKKNIVLNDWNAVKEALITQADNFGGRPPTFIFNEIRERSGITESDGAHWKVRRYFTMKTMRDLGFRDIFMEAIIMDEVEKLAERLKRDYHKKVIIMDDLFMNHLLNIIWGVSSGKKYEADDERIVEFAHILKITAIQNSSCNILEFLPFLKHVSLFKVGRDFQDFLRYTSKLYRYIDGEVDEHIRTYDEYNIRDFIDAYWQELCKRQKSNKKADMFTRKYLRGILYNFFNGGIDTGSNTLSWAFLYLVSWPKIQKKLQEELDRVVGRNRLPTWADHVNLPYTQALICEIQRFTSVLPLSFPHSCYKTTDVCGFTVPKDTPVLVNIWAVHNDPKLWGDPEVFRPERYINDNGKFEKPEYHIPFLTGKRVCIGQNLASMELYLFVTSLMHQFKMSLVTGEALPSFKPSVGISLRPDAFNVYVKYRNQ